jgi:hypothetical protein
MTASKTKTIEYDGADYDIVYRPAIGSKANIECLSSAMNTAGEVDAFRYLEERAKRQLISVGGDEFNNKMMYEWPDEFGLIVLMSLDLPTNQLAKNLERLREADQSKTSRPSILPQPLK